MATVHLDFDALVLQELTKFRESGPVSADSAQKLRDDLLLKLDALLEGNPILDRALDAVDRGRVSLAACSSSGRAIFQVQSSLDKRRETRKPDSSSESGSGVLSAHDAAASASRVTFDPIASGINPSGCYTVLPHFCSCAEFTFSVLPSLAGRRFCKHLLAVAIASCTKKYAVREVTDAEVTSLMELPA